MNPDEKPVSTDKKPARSSKKPVSPDEKPMNPEDKPRVLEAILDAVDNDPPTEEYVPIPKPGP